MVPGSSFLPWVCVISVQIVWVYYNWGNWERWSQRSLLAHKIGRQVEGRLRRQGWQYLVIVEAGGQVIGTPWIPLFLIWLPISILKSLWGFFGWVLGVGGLWVFLSHFVPFCHSYCECSLILTVGIHFQRTQLFLLLDCSLCMEASPVHVPRRSLSFYLAVLHFSSIWDSSVLTRESHSVGDRLYTTLLF